MHAAGWSFEKARAYYDDHGQPAHMDADGDGYGCDRYGYGRRFDPVPAHHIGAGQAVRRRVEEADEG
jgi:hypothetical protein